MAFNDDIKALIDASVDQPIEIQAFNIERCVNKLYQYILNGYQQSRESIQFAIGQLGRVHATAIVKMLFMAMDVIERNVDKFAHDTSAELSYYDNSVDQDDVLQLLEKIGPLMAGRQNLFEHIPNIAHFFSQVERKKIAGFCIDTISHYGLVINWDESIISSQTMLVKVMYSICKEDDVMELFFFWYYSILDRLNTSCQHQLSRDFAENLIVIGHQERMIAEAYYGASRAYTGASNGLAGLLYLNIALLDLDKRKMVCQRLAYEILWQMLKIIRVVKFNDSRVVTKLSACYESLGMDEYNDLSFYHTMFSAILTSDVEGTAKRIEEFLCDKRDVVYKHMEHSATPWYMLIMAVRNMGITGEYPVMFSFEAIMKTVLLQNGNKKLVDFCENSGGQVDLLIEELTKLETTRNVEDIGNDSCEALALSKKVLDKAVKEGKPENFILAMRPKSDFSFVMNDTQQKSICRKVEVFDPKVGDFKLPYADVDCLAYLLQTEQSDSVMWMGCGIDAVYRMTLLGTMYSFDELKCLKGVDPVKLQKETICRLQFSRTGRDSSGTIYDKNDLELKQESDDIFKYMKECQIAVPNIVRRIFFVKDMELSAIPHQLLIDERTSQFVGEAWPSANVISTEFLIKSNFNAPLSNGFSKSYWSPISKEGTLAGVKEHLQQLLDDYLFKVDDSDEPVEPLHSDLNIICVHGGDNIGDTELFYAGGVPIDNSHRVVGIGKVLVLFVCHSGSINYQHYDNSIHTIVKRYLRMGYSAVVAPVWSLNVDIIPVWLPEFMAVIVSGEYVVDAVYKANMKVKEQFITPSAWACLHLFGNPYMKIADQPILSIIENEGEENK